MISEVRQALENISFPDTRVYLNRYKEIEFKPGQVLEFDMGWRATPSTCVFAEPDAIKRSAIHFEVRLGGGVNYLPVYEGQDITDTVPAQILDKIR